jgi:hypothetical protein
VSCGEHLPKSLYFVWESVEFEVASNASAIFVYVFQSHELVRLSKNEIKRTIDSSEQLFGRL